MEVRIEFVTIIILISVASYIVGTCTHIFPVHMTFSNEYTILNISDCVKSVECLSVSLLHPCIYLRCVQNQPNYTVVAVVSIISLLAQS